MKKLSRKFKAQIDAEWEKQKAGNGHGKPTNYPPNEFIFADYIAKQKVETLRTEWVLWMLRMLHDANKAKKAFTADFIKNHPEAKKEPLMAPVTNIPASAPPQTPSAA